MRRRHYTRAELETIIRFAEDRERVAVYTCNQRLQKRLLGFGLKPTRTDQRGGLFFEFEGRRRVLIMNPLRKYAPRPVPQSFLRRDPRDTVQRADADAGEPTVSASSGVESLGARARETTEPCRQKQGLTPTPHPGIDPGASWRFAVR